jgi:hypothetical protein
MFMTPLNAKNNYCTGMFECPTQQPHECWKLKNSKVHQQNQLQHISSLQRYKLNEDKLGHHKVSLQVVYVCQVHYVA